MTKPSLILLLLIASVFTLVTSAQADPADYHYAGTLKIDDQSGHIDASWEITVHDTAESSIT